MKDYIPEEEIKKIENFDKILRDFITYIGKDCCECGRYRVQKFTSGALICEKCGTDQKTKETYKNEFGNYYDMYL